VNAFLAEGGEALAVPAGEVYVDVGTLNGYREAMRVLGGVQNSYLDTVSSARGSGWVVKA
jgi:hypothetical protein